MMIARCCYVPLLLRYWVPCGMALGLKAVSCPTLDRFQSVKSDREILACYSVSLFTRTVIIVKEPANPLRCDFHGCGSPITGFRNLFAFPGGSLENAAVSLEVCFRVDFHGGTNASEGEGGKEGYLGHGAGGMQSCAEKRERERCEGKRR
ncbi:MAG: hypothetical protein J3Q66DRAFT_342777 [Benniella sp.]|nr:MAG: hypothetical protein J3Q66DRAFT_342777 [Benniella sp.]